ncbi:MAG TPA: DUF2007 domain-containing protein [Candidatus Binatus sp.]|nr:DUF2007 domain-containing protein [Candidatus Binatus sp.]
MAHATDKPMISFITIATLHSRAEARPIVATLSAAGIRCLLADESKALSGGLTRGRQVEVKVQVNRRDVSRALELLTRRTCTHDPSVAASQRRHVIVVHIAAWQRVALRIGAALGAAGLLALLVNY